MFELGVAAVYLLALAGAIVLAVEFNLLVGVAAFLLFAAAFTHLVFNFDYPLVRRMVQQDDATMLNLCRSGFVGRARMLFKTLPANPRCRFCFVPFGGIGRLVGVRPSGKNPNYCRSCFEGLPTGMHEIETGVLFADIRGFTEFSEDHSTGDAALMLSRFYDIANKALTEDDAFVEFVGDQTMALYMTSMPSLGERTADVMLAAAERLIAAVHAENDALPVGVGLNLGPAQVGALAKGEDKDFTAVGDVVNTAARLQAQAGPFEIVLSETLYHKLSEQPSTEERRLELKGKAGATTAYVIPAKHLSAPDEPAA